MAMAMAEEHISKIDEYYAKAAEAARQRNAGRDDPNPEIVAWWRTTSPSRRTRRRRRSPCR